MSRVAVSMRFPAELAQALDRWAEQQESSRSGVVDAIITATTTEYRDQIINTPLPASPGERLNFQLRPESVERLKQLAGDLSPVEFLRRTVACVAAEDDTITGDEPDRASHASARTIHQARRPTTSPPGP